MKPRQRGFTLTELILVIVVMGLLAGVAIPRLNNRQSTDEMAVSDTLKGMLFTARKLAMSQRRPVCFVRNAATSQMALVYFAAGAGCAWLNPAVIEPGTGKAFVVDLPTGIVFSNASAVQFTTRGQLSPNVTTTITVGSTNVTIIGETGFSY
ncbi:MAG: prepilin-type N-terminal cleavage/methylation domain-containing protein [Burkholderiales bacterium]|nr:prepilin-type N-terminal cleavage/methylation domain-containing protein [Burkholderiales bacterium]